MVSEKSVRRSFACNQRHILLSWWPTYIQYLPKTPTEYHIRQDMYLPDSAVDVSLWYCSVLWCGGRKNSGIFQ